MSSRPGTVGVAEPAWERAVTVLSGAREVALICHVNPDGDALGSLLGLGQALRARSRRVVGCWPGGTVMPATYGYLPGQSILVTPSAFPTAPEVLVVLDASSPERLGGLADRLATAGTVVVVDHHAHGEGIDGVLLVDDRAAATAVIVEELLRRLGLPLTADIATCLFTGVTTDTGSFKFASATAAVHELAARLLATGIRHDDISRRVFDTTSLGYLRLLGTALGRTRLEASAAGGLGLVWTHTTTHDLETNGVAFADVERIIDVVRSAVEAEVAAVLKQDLDGSWQVSVRSKGAVDVGAVCLTLGGGGHRHAAGYTSADGLAGAVTRLRAALDVAVPGR
ncbi:MAG TPA: DHH family phosphoesterase [Mycobacteriales bacterium]|nr:DHH family phosphoesterase [Mycobacteriales bacterium]